MDARRHSAQTKGLALIAAAALIATLTIPSCSLRTREGVQGQTDVPADYQGRQLRASLPCYIQVQSVLAAAEVTLRRRGLSIVDSKIDTNEGHVIASPPHGSSDRFSLGQSTLLTERIKVSAGFDHSAENGCTWVRILVEPAGDEAVSRSLLEEMLFVLGL